MERNSVYSDNLGKERLEIQRIVNLIRNRDLQSDAGCGQFVIGWFGEGVPEEHQYMIL
jgi:hypothetical protein